MKLSQKKKLNKGHLKMNKNIQRTLKLTNFFMPKLNENKSFFILKQPSRIIMQNINYKWFEFIHTKTHQAYTIYFNNKPKQSLPYGFIKKPVSNFPAKTSIDYNDILDQANSNFKLELTLFFPRQDIMQQFIKWQRYRKYWWSSITTTPSLFQISDMKTVDDVTNVNIVANFTWGQYIVEKICLHLNEKENSTPSLVCTTGLENALLTIMLDGQTNITKEGYLRLHNKIAPYKISFAVNSRDSNEKEALIDLATLFHYKLQSSKISTWLPDFKLPLDSQIKENLELGVTYTAIFDQTTLANGIFNLLYSSTMLREQVHVADFKKYAGALCRR